MSDEKFDTIIYLGKQNDFVYDIETETHDFICGFSLTVHNTDSFVLSMKTKKIIKDLKNLEDVLDFSNLYENHELFGNKAKKLVVYLK